jgi:hypothetical protein
MLQFMERRGVRCITIGRGILVMVLSCSAYLGRAKSQEPLAEPEFVEAAVASAHASNRALPATRWTFTSEAIFAQPRFSQDTALLVADENLNGDSRSHTVPFRYGFSSAPRISIDYHTPSDIGLRASWWMLSNDAESITQNPPASGFGEVTHPALFGVDLSSVVPAETLTAKSQFELYSIDIEVTKRATLHHWELLASAGLRHANFDHQTQYELLNVANLVAGRASLHQRLTGLGPTVSFTSRRLAWDRFLMSATLRASMLMAESDLELQGAEDLDLATPFTTLHLDSTPDLLPIIETRWEGKWTIHQSLQSSLTCNTGVEAQWWSGVGTASDPNADLAILGLTIGAAWNW